MKTNKKSRYKLPIKINIIHVFGKNYLPDSIMLGFHINFEEKELALAIVFIGIEIKWTGWKRKK